MQIFNYLIIKLKTWFLIILKIISEKFFLVQKQNNTANNEQAEY